MAIPFTLVSKVPPASLNRVLHHSPENYPIPNSRRSIQQNSTDAFDHFQLLGIYSFYSKEIATTDVAFTPTFMKPVEEVMEDSMLYNLMLSNPYAYFADTISSGQIYREGGVVTEHADLLKIDNPSPGNFNLINMTNNGFEFEISLADSSVFVLQQLLLPGWKARLNNENVNLYPVNHAYMAVLLPAGKHNLKIYYRPGMVIGGLILSVLSITAVCLIIFIKPRQRNA